MLYRLVKTGFLKLRILCDFMSGIFENEIIFVVFILLLV